jgi:DNA-binding MarR family transcriptional regulator
METKEPTLDAARWLKRRDAWIRQLVSYGFVSRNGKLTGVYVAMRMSAKRPFTYPAMKSIAKDLGVSTRQIARALKELEDEKFIRVKRTAGKTSYYSLDL